MLFSTQHDLCFHAVFSFLTQCWNLIHFNNKSIPRRRRQFSHRQHMAAPGRIKIDDRVIFTRIRLVGARATRTNIEGSSVNVTARFVVCDVFTPPPAP